MQSKSFIVLLVAVLAIVNSNINFGKDHWRDILESDAKGYYAYLPAVFIYQDPNFGFFDRIEKVKYYDKNLFYEYRIGTPGGKIIDKYFCGTAICEAPFFLIAHAITLLSGGDADGYSRLYPLAITISALVFLTIGLFFLDSTLKLYGISDRLRSYTLFVAVFGTNLFYYTISQPGFSHVYSFAFVCAFLYYAKKYFLLTDDRSLAVIGAILGMIVLIRPVNGLVVFALPFVAASGSGFLHGLKQATQKRSGLLAGGALFLSIVFIQLIYYKVATGDFFVYSYGKEGFQFSRPHMIDILFSYKKGLFVYTPIYLVSLVGLFHIWKNSKYEAFAISVFLVSVTYVLSSWWNWYYGGSFSSRVFVEYLPFFMLLFAAALKGIAGKRNRMAFVSLTIFLTAFCQFQTYQYRYFIIHWSDMDKERYWETIRSIGNR